jgi:tetratricopeptide (TPR) repeat protein
MNYFKIGSLQFGQVNFAGAVLLSLCFSLFPQLQPVVLAKQASGKPQPATTTQAVAEYPFDCALSLRDKNINQAALFPLNPSANLFHYEIDLAAMYVEAGHKSKALEFLSQAEINLTESNDLRLCLTLVRAEQYDRVIKLLGKIQKLEDRVDTSARIAKTLAEHNQNEKAAEILSQVIANFKPVAREAFILSNIAVTYAKIGQFAKALQFARRIQSRWAHVRAEALTEIAFEYTKKGNKGEASAILKQAHDIAKIIGNGEVELWTKGEAFAKVAATYVNNEQKAEALSVLSEGLKIAQKAKTQSISLEKLAIVYAQAKEFEQALLIAKSIDYKPAELDVYLETARELLKESQQAKALTILDQAYEGTRKLKRENDTFKIRRLAEIAILYANANQSSRAYEALHFALQIIRLAYPTTQIGHLIETARGFYKAKLEIDSESRELLRKICAKEPILPSQKELDKRRECEEVADRFIQRWHETLDLNILFDEMYIANPQQRKRNVAMFYGVYKFLTGSAGPKLDKGFNDEIFQAGFFAFWNSVYLGSESRLVIPNGEEREKHEQLALEDAKYQEGMKKLNLSDKVMSVKPVQQYIEAMNKMLSFLRKGYPREVFETEVYKENLKKRYDQEKNEFEKDFRIIEGFSEYGVKDDVEVYYLKRGVFRFYFVEEEGKPKVLTLGFEL